VAHRILLIGVLTIVADACLPAQKPSFESGTPREEVVAVA
jgi:hypothetical protein